GLDAVNLSLDTLRADRFRRITGREGCEETVAAIHAAAHAGFRKVKVNAVVMQGVNDDELVDLARAFARDLPIEMRYIEYMPDEGEIDLRAPLREGATDGDLAALIEEGLRRKLAGHAPAQVLKDSQKAAGPGHARSMIRIGG